MVRLNPVEGSFQINGRANYLDFRISTPSTVMTLQVRYERFGRLAKAMNFPSNSFSGWGLPELIKKAVRLKIDDASVKFVGIFAQGPGMGKPRV